MYMYMYYIYTYIYTHVRTAPYVSSRISLPLRAAAAAACGLTLNP